MNKPLPLQILYVNLGDNISYTYDKPAGRILGWTRDGNFVKVLVPELSSKAIVNEICLKDPFHIEVITLPFSNSPANSVAKIMLSYLLRILISPIVIFKIDKTIDFAFSNSSFLVDFVPVLWLKLFGKCKHWVLMMDSVVPSPKNRGGNKFVNSLTHAESILVGWIGNLFADLIFTVNPELKQEMIKRGISESKIALSQNGLFLENIKLAEKSKNEEFDAVYMGRISVNKGVFDLIEVWKQIVLKIPKAKLVIMGTGLSEIIEEFKGKIKQNGLDENITYLGFIRRPRKYEVLKNSKIFLYLSKVNADESWGISLMEALACGLPAISYDLPIYEHIYKTEGLIRVKLNDVSSVTEKLLYLLENQKSWLFLSKKSINFAKNFDWFKIAEADLKKIRKIVISSDA